MKIEDIITFEPLSLEDLSQVVGGWGRGYRVTIWAQRWPIGKKWLKSFLGLQKFCDPNPVDTVPGHGETVGQPPLVVIGEGAQ